MSTTAPDLQDVKVAIEALSYRFRKIQKLSSKSVESEISVIKSLQSNYDKETADRCRERLLQLRSKIIESHKEEKRFMSKLKLRCSKLAEGGLDSQVGSYLT